MSEIVIKAENLGKKYMIGHQSERTGYTTLRDMLMQNARSLWNKTKDLATGKPIIQGDIMEEIWALQDINLEIKRGEAIGIIGRNGAGKSTLLKILSRITEPSTGQVIIKGRVASLLEVGTGFHPELSGRENIYLNGTIMGMTRGEIKRKFDEIVAFAEVEKYLDTPVKRYSSGMYVRLAFAVAAHLDPEILIVDEVLAVGDIQFQKKCLGKMENVSAQEGRTVLFVSHNMVTIRQLCNKGILLNEGKIGYAGTTAETISYYEKNMYSVEEGVWVNNEIANNKVYLERIAIHDRDNKNRSLFLNSEIIRIEMHAHTIETTDNVKLGFDLIKQGIIVLRSQQTDSIDMKHFNKGEKYVFTCELPGWTLNAGEYFIRPLSSIHCVESLTMHTEPVLSFNVEIDPDRSEFHGVLNESNNPGGVFLMLEWTVKY